jgi:hypothetical protein
MWFILVHDFSFWSCEEVVLFVGWRCNSSAPLADFFQSRITSRSSVAIVFVIFITPIAFCVPAALVFIPPAVIGAPAVLANFG